MEIRQSNYLDGQEWGDNTDMYTAGTNTARYTFNIPEQDIPGISRQNSFGSIHAGGFHMAMCDGSVRQISYTINRDVHKWLGNRRDGQATDVPSD